MKEIIDSVFEQDRYAKHLNFQIEEWGDGFAKTSVVVDKQHTNFNGATNGGLTFSLADYAFAIASNSDGQIAVGIDTYMSFTRAGKLGEKLTCVAKEEHKGRKTAVYQMVVKNEEGKLLAKMLGTVYRTGKNHL